MLWSFVYLGLCRPREFLLRLDVVTVGVSAFQRLVAAELACFTDAVVVYGIASSLSHDIDDFCAMAAEACIAQPARVRGFVCRSDSTNSILPGLRRTGA